MDEATPEATPHDNTMSGAVVTTCHQVMSIYASVLRGQVMAVENLPDEEKMAAVLYTSAVLHEMHTMVLAELGKKGVSPAWLHSPEKITEQSKICCEEVVRA